MQQNNTKINDTTYFGRNERPNKTLQIMITVIKVNVVTHDCLYVVTETVTKTMIK